MALGTFPTKVQVMYLRHSRDLCQHSWVNNETQTVLLQTYRLKVLLMEVFGEAIFTVQGRSRLGFKRLKWLDFRQYATVFPRDKFEVPRSLLLSSVLLAWKGVNMALWKSKKHFFLHHGKRAVNCKYWVIITTSTRATVLCPAF